MKFNEYTQALCKKYRLNEDYSGSDVYKSILFDTDELIQKIERIKKTILDTISPYSQYIEYLELDNPTSWADEDEDDVIIGFMNGDITLRGPCGEYLENWDSGEEPSESDPEEQEAFAFLDKYVGLYDIHINIINSYSDLEVEISGAVGNITQFFKQGANKYMLYY